jgi:transforming growth factor-beta-induced protein
MRTFKLNLKNLALVAIVVSALVAVSCSKDDDFIPGDAVALEEVDLKAGKALPPSEQSIAEIAIGAGFDSLVVALQYVDAEEGTELVDLFLNGTDQYTVFAPTNEAFAALVNGGRISDLPSDVVLKVLLYHVAEGRRAANSVVPKTENKREVTTLLGQSFWVDSYAVIHAYANSAQINVAGGLYNISASNGIIHVIDTVILPDL